MDDTRASRLKQATVGDEDDGIRLDRWFARHQPQMPRILIQKLLRKKAIRLDGKRAEAGTRLAKGQVLSFPTVEAKQYEARPAKQEVAPEDAVMLQQAVLYKDKDILIINKPFGLAVQGGSKITRHVDGMLDALRFELRERPKLVHRLDRDTSGVLVLARHAKSADYLMKLFAGKGIEKRYAALVLGLPQPRKGTIDLPLAKDFGKVKEKMIVTESGKPAVTRYQVLDMAGTAFALMELIPVTGRTHQLRAHMEAIGHPIVGDGKYAGKIAYPAAAELAPKLHLHARAIALPLLSGKILEIKAPLPKHMKESLKTLGLSNET